VNLIPICCFNNRYLHGWLQHRFPAPNQQQYQLIARARQFSSFLVIVGTMAGPDKFDPKEAIILQNKDEVLIPLLTNVLPTAKEFKDAVASLSPEQKAFAESFRAMQLESSVFGVCVIQLKPQLERLLELPEGSLTKEIQLTQDLMSLFVEYQIPGDLLSYDGAVDADVSSKVSKVKVYVQSVLDVIESAKEKQLIEEERKADMRAEAMFANHSPIPPPMADSRAGSLMGANESYSPARTRPATFAMRFGMGENNMAAPVMQSPPMMMRSCAPPAPVAHATSVIPYDSEFTTSSNSGKRPEQMQPGRQMQESQGPTDVPFPGSTLPVGDDFTLIPKVLDKKLEKYDTSNALRSTIIKTGPNWTRMRQDNLLTPIKASNLSPSDIETEKKKAFDLLDAISRSGTLPIACAELHVIVGVSHCFDNDLMGTVIQDNINPIEKCERSSLMIASTIYGEPANTLVVDEQQLERLTGSFPLLFADESG
jgi:hypothetical protein